MTRLSTTSGRSAARDAILAMAILGLFLLASCFKVPLGDPQKSTVDPNLRGFWDCRKDSEGMLVVIAPFDEHAYVLDAISYELAGDDVRVKEHTVFKAWLTEIKGRRFMTLDVLSQLAMPADAKREREYPVLELTVKDDQIVTKTLDQDFEGFKNVKTGDELAKAIEQNLDNQGIYYKDSASTYKRLSFEKDKEFIQKVVK